LRQENNRNLSKMGTNKFRYPTSCWHGWFIEQSFDDQSVYSRYPTVRMKSEEENWKEHVVRIPDEDIEDVVMWVEAHLQPKWYAHMIKGDKMIVVYPHKTFRLHKDDSFEAARAYGLTQNIPEDQLPSKSLFTFMD
jgi:hypothetical protein